MVADYMPHNRSEQKQAYRAKRSKPVTKAKNDKFGSRNPDGSMYAPPPRKSKQVRPD